MKGNKAIGRKTMCQIKVWAVSLFFLVNLVSCFEQSNAADIEHKSRTDAMLVATLISHHDIKNITFIQAISGISLTEGSRKVSNGRFYASASIRGTPKSILHSLTLWVLERPIASKDLKGQARFIKAILTASQINEVDCVEAQNVTALVEAEPNQEQQVVSDGPDLITYSWTFQDGNSDVSWATISADPKQPSCVNQMTIIQGRYDEKGG